MKPTMFVKPSAPIGERWGLAIDSLYLQGFATAHDAWVFCVANLMIDPLHPLSDREFTLSPEETKPEQLRMM